ncbi:MULTISPECIES: universal stress protein [Acinetobacter]|jgi:nucleotide-binding universal stress UspA family protein|uniref:universal stress protein n=1 Tax=Acinetobacter TaxID=469 RepID=UPI0002AEB3E9|nr:MULTISPECIES: universal stress protein [Acinetobacter]ATZ64686.1 universal stress protein [Acinetobacter bereziniae]ELW80288.1 universal stress family protein [Acinetobacter sp. WC-743]KKW80259.1 universal stress protein [Acinetobacter sp. Ag2]MBI0396264.1 universal stress protein [Acinetobacter bereziniae]MBJ8424971.1 universal stress protein [Acinetobacter bereziniae]
MAYQNILVPVDGSETSLSVVKHAVEFAKAFKSKITVVQVMTLDPYIASEYLANGQSNMLIERAREFIQANINEAKAQFAAEGVQVETRLLEGENIAHTLNQAVQDLKTDLVILSSHGRTGLKKIIMGSVAQNLLTELQIPVLVIK